MKNALIFDFFVISQNKISNTYELLSQFQEVKMPVRCLGGGSASNNGGLAKPKDVIVTSTVLNAAFISPFLALFN